MKVTDLIENEVIHVRTEQEAIAICQLMDNAGLKWCNDKLYIDNNEWDSYGEICFFPKNGTFSSYEYALSVKAYKSLKIYPASLFLEPSYEIY